MQKLLYIGIDLGTTNCCAAVHYPTGITSVIVFPSGDRLLRSAVCFASDGSIKVGKIALIPSEIKNGNVIVNSKRLFGMDFNDSHLIQMKGFCKAKIIEGPEGKAGFFIPSLNRFVSPEEVSVHLIKALFDECMIKVGQGTVGCVVVTVPATYTQVQRAMTREAAVRAGIQCHIRILNEPTAAAIAYGVQVINRSGITLIYDLGGGTFDVSIVSVKNGKEFDFKHKLGDMSIGGESFDRSLVMYIQYQIQHTIDERLVINNDNMENEQFARVLSHLIDDCKEAKESLSIGGIDNYTIDIHDYKRILTRLLDLSIEEISDEPSSIYITHTIFNSLIQREIDRTMSITKMCIHQAGYNISDISTVVLVGGSSRIPLVRTLLSEIFTREKLCQGVHADECVAFGAALFYSQEIIDGIKDKTNYDISVETTPNNFCVIIPKDKYYPYCGQHTFHLGKNNIGFFKTPVYEGSGKTGENRKLLTQIIVDDEDLQGSAHSLIFYYRINEEGQLTVRVVEERENRTLIEEKCVL